MIVIKKKLIIIISVIVVFIAFAGLVCYEMFTSVKIDFSFDSSELTSDIYEESELLNYNKFYLNVNIDNKSVRTISNIKIENAVQTDKYILNSEFSDLPLDIPPKTQENIRIPIYFSKDLTAAEIKALLEALSLDLRIMAYCDETNSENGIRFFSDAADMVFGDIRLKDTKIYV